MKHCRLVSPDELKDIFARHIRASGWLYIVAYKRLVGEYGFAGRTTIREWMRTWGIWRGEQTRKGHQALGLEINMANLLSHWDSDAASTPEMREAWRNNPNGKFTPNCVKVTSKHGHYSCPQEELWEEQNFLYEAHVHCDEFHVKYTQGYCPNATVVVPECMTKGDEACNFTFLRDPDAPEPPKLPLYEGENPLADRKADTPQGQQACALRRKARITAGRIVFLWLAIKKHHPDRAEQLFDEIMDDWTRERGNDLKKFLLDNKLSNKISADTFEYFDHPYFLTWNADIEENDKEVRADIDYCPFAETWKWVAKENLPILQRGYCSVCYMNIFNRAFPGSNAVLSKCLLKGDNKCTIKISKSE